jgi:hypothetical protein
LSEDTTQADETATTDDDFVASDTVLDSDDISLS